jgi:DNA (cytosine-5)-methyltransferase 1
MVDDIKVIDLFCGAGGMSAGFIEADFRIIGAIDFDSDSIETIKNNHNVGFTAVENLERYKPEELAEELDQQRPDVIIGGPPCQGFSTASMNPKAKPNFGPNNKYDRRNVLYRRFFDFVSYLKPTCFVMENVPGLKSRGNGYYKKEVENLGTKLGYDVEIWDLVATQYGVPQVRKRVFFIGIPKGTDISQPQQTHYPHETVVGKPRYVSVGEAILDLPVLSADDGAKIMDYDKTRVNKFENDDKFDSSYAKWARKGSRRIYHHISRKHSTRDLGIFKQIKAGSSSAQLPSEQQKLLPYKMKSFKDKFRKQPLFKPSTTVTAHLAKDGLYYIHPTQNRSLTQREAARLQSFQDKFIFTGSRTSIYKQIGNAVPPLMAKAIAKALLKVL